MLGRDNVDFGPHPQSTDPSFELVSTNRFDHLT